MAKNEWFEVDKEGLAKIQQRRNKLFLVAELISNAWDEPGTARVDVKLSPSKISSFYGLTVVDDNPSGFKDLADAFTLFAESKKNRTPGQRGRFNLGEKLVLACAKEAKIATTTGTINFNADGSRSRSHSKTISGSRFDATIRMTKEEYGEIEKQISMLIPPDNIVYTMFNGTEIYHRKPVVVFQSPLQTEIADDEGSLRRTIRNTVISVYCVYSDEKSHIYELGIPIVETGDKYHVSIEQKIPLNLDRDNVQPSYLRKVRTLVLNHVFDKLENAEEANAPWVRDALEDKNCEADAAATIVKKRFGDKAVAFDPSDVEGSKLAVSKGYTVIPGATFSKAAWEKIRESGSIPPAGKVTPSPKAYGNGEQMEYVDKKNWTDGMKKLAIYIKQVAKDILDGKEIFVKYVKEKNWPFSATYGPSGEFTINLASLGKSFSEVFPENILQVDNLILHEMAHEFVTDHLSEAYHQFCTKLGARLKSAVLYNTRFYKKFASNKGQFASMLK